MASAAWQIQAGRGVDLGMAAAPEETTILRFSHMLERHDLGGPMLEAANGESGGQGDQDPDRRPSWMRHYPCAFFNQEPQRRARPGEAPDPQGQAAVLRAEAHIGVDAKVGTVHTMVTTSANVADANVLCDLLHGEGRKVRGDGGYQGQTAPIQQAASKVQNMTCRRTKFKRYVEELQKERRGFLS